MKIVLATETDVQEIMDLIEACIIDLESQSIYQWNSYYPRLNHINECIKDKSLYILREDEMFLGIISITEKQPPEYKNVNWLEEGKFLVISKLLVNPKWQRKGIGRVLMDFAENFARKYTSIRLDAYSGNPRALNFYERLGYVKVGKLFFPKRELPFYAYEKLLNSKNFYLNQ